MWKLINKDALEALKELEPNSLDSLVTDPPAGIGFMGSKISWDKDKGGRDKWINWLTFIMLEVHRVLKPGAWGAVWALPRTSHWTVLALENAGFEIRDIIVHLQFTGFPKTVNIGKEIDRVLGKTAERKIVGENPNHRKNNKTYELVYSGANTGAKYLTEEVSDEAKKWKGFGTSLKPFNEHWILIRKPHSENTIAENILKWGTGALNIEDSRISTNRKLTRKLGKTTVSPSGWESVNRSEIAGKDGGSWPPNVIIDEGVGRLLDEQAGKEYGEGPSSFFYTPKPSRKEKDAGLEELETRLGGEVTGRKEGSRGLGNPRAGAGRNGNVKNFHPTVKALNLMEYLVKLVTPPGGTVLDCFAGSGTTLCAAVKNGFNAIGIDNDTEEGYIDLATARIKYWEKSR